jgi:hypothetical protein
MSASSRTSDVSPRSRGNSPAFSSASGRTSRGSSRAGAMDVPPTLLELLETARIRGLGWLLQATARAGIRAHYDEHYVPRSAAKEPTPAASLESVAEVPDVTPACMRTPSSAASFSMYADAASTYADAASTYADEAKADQDIAREDDAELQALSELASSPASTAKLVAGAANDGLLPRSLSASASAARLAALTMTTGTKWRPADNTRALAREHVGGVDRAGRGDTVVGRIVLSSMHRPGPQYSNAPILHAECKGVVIDAQTWRIISLPPRNFSLNPPHAEVDSLLARGLYDIVRVDEGTLVTLHTWQHPVEGQSWCLSTSNGYDVSSLRWMGELTYAEAFFSLMETLYPEAVARTGLTLLRGEDGRTQLQFSDFPPHFCVTVGMRHPHLHPLPYDPPRLWQIQVTDLSGAEPVILPNTEGLPGIPRQKVYDPKDLIAAIRLGAPDATEITCAGLQALNAGALERAKEYIAKARDAQKSGAPPPAPAEPYLPRQPRSAYMLLSDASAATAKIPRRPVPPAAGASAAKTTGGALPVSPFQYGFILRSRDTAVTGPLSDILLDSDLLVKLRQLVYDKMQYYDYNAVTAKNRLEYNAMRAFLSRTDRTAFRSLFPQWEDAFTAYANFVKNVTDAIVHIMRAESMKPVTRVPAPNTPTTAVAMGLLAHIRSREAHFNPFNEGFSRMLEDYVNDPNYAYLYLRALRRIEA